MGNYTIRPLSLGTWDSFAAVAERHHGCWCMRFQRSCTPKRPGEGNQDRKERLVSEGRAHAALVFDGADAMGWCQYGSPEELPDLYRHLSSTTAPAACSNRPASATTGPKAGTTA